MISEFLFKPMLFYDSMKNVSFTARINRRINAYMKIQNLLKKHRVTIAGTTVHLNRCYCIGTLKLNQKLHSRWAGLQCGQNLSVACACGGEINLRALAGVRNQNNNLLPTFLFGSLSQAKASHFLQLIYYSFCSHLLHATCSILWNKLTNYKVLN